MHITISEMAQLLRRERAFKIIYHINPDGDCIGSAFALALILRSIGAKCKVAGRDPVPEQFRYLTDPIPMDEVIDPIYIAVDCSDKHRVGEDLADQHFTYWPDHHTSPDEEQADYEFRDSTRSSCCEIILKLAEAIGVKVTKQIANLLFTGLVTDTRCFRTRETDAITFETAAKLKRYGADSFGITRWHTMVKTEKRLKLESQVYRGMQVLCGGKLVIMMITLADLERAGIDGQDAPDMASINALGEVIDIAEMTVMLREYPDGRTRFSVKTFTDNVQAIDIAKQLGGGGHPDQAGGFLSLTPEEAREKMTKTCTAYFAKHGIAND